jgi:hypothetical protein
MRFSTEQSVALSAALLALPAIAAPVQPQGERQSEVAHAQQPAAAEPATPAVRPASNDEEVPHRVAQIPEVQGGLRVPKTRVGSSREGKSRRPAGESRLREGGSRHREGASSHREGESRLREGESRNPEGTSSHREGESHNREGTSSHREGEARRPSQGEARLAHLQSSEHEPKVAERMERMPFRIGVVENQNNEEPSPPFPHYVEARGRKTDKIVNGANTVSEVGNAASDIVQTGENLWDSAKSALKTRGKKVDSVVNGVHTASEVGNAASDIVQTGENLWDSAESAWDDVKSS